MRTFTQILTAAGFDVEPYSGRGMGGNECASVTITPGVMGGSPLGRFIADVMVAMEAEEIDVVADAFRKMRVDTFGEGEVAYFPGYAADQ